MTISYEIHPGIGIARLGGSDEYFLGPEPDCADGDYFQDKAIQEPRKLKRWQPRAADGTPLQTYRDGGGKLKRQAARFRVFKVDRAGDNSIISSIEAPATTTIEWSIQLGNRKAAATKFDGKDPRNAKIQGADREKKLVIKGNMEPVSATAAGQEPIKGTFNDTIPVELGDAWMSGNRLYVLGGRGHSDSVPALDPPSPSQPLDFANNDGWYDDTSDGVIRAKVTDGGQQFDAVPARVIVAPFDFAPEIDSFITLYDVAYQAAVERDWIAPPATTSFYRDVLPVLQRVRTYRWVNAPTMRAETQDRHTSWRDIAAALADKNDPNGKKFRQMLFAHLRHPLDQNQGKRQVLMPRLFDDEYNGVLPLTPVMYAHFERWKNGDFDNSAPATPESEFACEALDRIALQACSGGAFYPGMEAPRIMRDPGTYGAAFRIDPQLPPGRITEGLAVPWQADFFQCQVELDNAWWPATRPDHVFLGQPKKKVDQQPEEMHRWDEGVDDERAMVQNWTQLGIVRRFEVNAGVPGSDLAKDLSGGDRYFVFYEDGRLLARP